MTDRQRCLILGSKQALDRIAPALDQVVEALDVERVPVPDLHEVSDGRIDADLVIAEVTKPSAFVSFEVGIAVARRIPVVFLAAEGAIPSPVFTPYLEYNASLPAARLAYLIAKHADARRDPEPIPALYSGDVWSPPYAFGDRFEGVVSHVESNAGYALVHTPRTAPAILHVSQMTSDLASRVENGAAAPGERVWVEVTEVDFVKHRVLLRQTEPTKSRARNRDLYLLAQFYENVWTLERLVRDLGADDLAKHPLLGHDEARKIALLRKLRRDAAHGARLAREDLVWGALEAETLTAILGKWAGRGSNPEPTA